ncbi:MAG: hypothetical protein KDI01_00595 [Halioglobus sp.]|nr:hypothetical protein [Halioglobus sp.]
MVRIAANLGGLALSLGAFIVGGDQPIEPAFTVGIAVIALSNLFLPSWRHWG